MMEAFYINKPMQGKLTQVKIPLPKEDEILLKVIAAGICGTDIHIYNGEYFGGYPRIPGHEFSGIIEAVGKKVTRFKEGQVVSADPNIFCETCEACKENRQNFCENMHAVGVTRHGAFAQFLTVPERCVFDITGLSFAEGALIEPLACVVYGQEKVGIPLGASVLIFGAGPIGLMHSQLSAINGAASVTVVDLFQEKLDLARQLGADHVYESEEFSKLKACNLYDVVIDCTGIPEVVETAIKYVKDSGAILFFGVCPNKSSIKINPYEIFKRELRIVGSFALKKTFGKALAYAKSGKIKLSVLVDQRFPLDETPLFFGGNSQVGRGLKNVCYPNGLELD